MRSAKNTAILLMTCPDQKGIVASVTAFLHRHGANLVHSDQHQDSERRLLFMRIEWELDEFDLPTAEFGAAFEEIASRFRVHWRLSRSDERPKVAILVSRQDHCLADLLYRHRSGQLRCEIPLVISNHPETEDLSRFYGIPFRYLAIDPERKEEIERRQLALLEQHQIDLVILARYMQILSPRFVSAYPERIINIHHSFLPAFVGQKPYHRAFDRGVKLIGATSHYVTEGLDEGPIIEQDVIRVSHRDQVEELIEKGKDLERVVLSRAVRWHLDSRIAVYGNKTVVFD